MLQFVKPYTGYWTFRLTTSKMKSNCFCKNRAVLTYESMNTKVLLFWSCQWNRPNIQTQQTINSSYFSGCYYQYQYYEEGEQIRTSEPCLNCTCHNQMLMCYLRVCPFIKPVGRNCVVEKRDDQCCPTIMCPEGNLSILLKLEITSSKRISTYKRESDISR